MARTGPKRRTAANSRSKAAGSALWAGFRIAKDEPEGCRKAFERLVKALKTAGTYDRTDPAIVFTAARTLHYLALADAEIDEKGLVVLSGNGTPFPNPAATMRNALVMRLRGAFTDMGLTAASSKFGNPTADDSSDQGDGWGGLLTVTG